MKKATFYVVCLGALGLSMITVGVLVLIFFQKFVTNIIHQRLGFVEGSESFEMWRVPPVHPMTRAYLFNITNVDDVWHRSAKPIVQEVGPYTYIETWEREILGWHSDGTFTYRNKKVFKFAPELSSGSEDDVISAVYVPMMSAVYNQRFVSRVMRLAMQSMFKTVFKVTPFKNITVRDFLWGQEDQLIKLAIDIAPEGQKPPYSKFGFMVGKNGTSRRNVTAKDGVDNIKEKAQIVAYDGLTKLPFWKTDECNIIKGTDGSAFQPDIKKDTTLYLFDPDLCRPLPFVFEKEVLRQGVQAYRFTPPDDVFANYEVKKENECYCTAGPESCAPSGVFNLSACQYNSPALLSFPHFYNADPVFLEGVDGLNPDKNKHQFFFDINPQLGLALQAKARFQINLQLLGLYDIETVRNIPNVTLPILWFEAGIEEMPENVIALIQQGTVMPAKIESATTAVLFILGFALIVVVIIVISRRKGLAPCKSRGTKRMAGLQADNPLTINKNGVTPQVNGGLANGKSLDEKLEEAVPETKIANGNGHPSPIAVKKEDTVV